MAAWVAQLREWVGGHGRCAERSKSRPTPLRELTGTRTMLLETARDLPLRVRGSAASLGDALGCSLRGAGKRAGADRGWSKAPPNLRGRLQALGEGSAERLSSSGELAEGCRETHRGSPELVGRSVETVVEAQGSWPRVAANRGGSHGSSPMVPPIRCRSSRQLDDESPGFLSSSQELAEGSEQSPEAHRGSIRFDRVLFEPAGGNVSVDGVGRGQGSLKARRVASALRARRDELATVAEDRRP